MTWLIRISGSILSLVLLFLGWVYWSTHHPDYLEAAFLECTEEAPRFDINRPLKVMSYNVQYFAGKGYLFYYDLPENSGPDLRPESASIHKTLDGVAELIKEQQPDILFLQEVHDGAAATDNQDQLKELERRLYQGMYPCYASTFYWKADFVPHPKIAGSVGMKLITLSRYRIEQAERIALPQPPMDWISARFYLKRAILQVDLPTIQGSKLTLMNTHFDAFAQGSDTMEKQVEIARNLLSEKNENNTLFILAGDFNLLPPGAFEDLQQSQQYLYQKESELVRLLDTWPSVPALSDMQSVPPLWFTHFPNDPDVSGPDRSIDYIFYSQNMKLIEKKVLTTEQTLTFSDHLPVVATFSLPEK